MFLHYVSFYFFPLCTLSIPKQESTLCTCKSGKAASTEMIGRAFTLVVPEQGAAVLWQEQSTQCEKYSHDLKIPFACLKVILPSTASL